MSARISAENRFLEALQAAGHISRDAADRARAARAASHVPICEALTSLGILEEGDLGAALAGHLNAQVWSPPTGPDVTSMEGINFEFLSRSRVVPLSLGDDHCEVAVQDPFDDFARDALAAFWDRPCEIVIARSSDINKALDQLAPTIEDLDGAPALDGREFDVQRLRDLSSEAPVIRAVNALIDDAVAARASDIHIEPMEDRLVIRYRIDGALTKVAPPVGIAPAALVSRFKIMAHLDIAERRLPQDGRIKHSVRGREIDFRVSTAPSQFGESVVLRILDRRAVRLDFAELGFSEAQTASWKNILKEPHGIVLATGPTGSGKTTTLYASLTALNHPDRKILTIEDPVEYLIDGINQAQVDPKIDLTFASALRAFLRQDPDIMLVGEIRDGETARIATQAALTGHLVLSSLHTNDALGAVLRMTDLGVEPFLVASTLRGIIGQRLVRRLCPDCAEPYEPSEALIKAHGLAMSGDLVRLWKPVGCASCGGSGYKGRIAILEILSLSGALHDLVGQNAPRREIELAARDAGFVSLKEDGIEKALLGLTTLEDVLAVTRDEAGHAEV